MTAFEIAKQFAEKRQAEKLEHEAKIREEEEKKEATRVRLAKHVQETMDEFSKHGFDQLGNSLYKKGFQAADIEVRMTKIDQNEAEYKIHYLVFNNYCQIKCNASTANTGYFDRDFGEAMSKWIIPQEDK